MVSELFRPQLKPLYFLALVLSMSSSAARFRLRRPAVPHSPPPAAITEPSFRTEFSKPEIFVGEQVMVNYVVYSNDDYVEVEVAKFPEFRGYWNENLVLRQGPIPTMMGMNGSPHSAIVGTYLLTPMIGQQAPSITPMKIVLRNPLSKRMEGSSPPNFVFSEGPPPKINPLPALPASIDPRLFTGGVGRFEFVGGEATLPFLKDEPTLVRVTLQGQGNFQEVNDLYLPLPPTVTLLSKRSVTQGGGQYAAKSFEFTISVKNDQNVTLPPLQMAYFDPEEKKYIVLQAAPLTLQYTPKAAIDTTSERPPLVLPGLENDWSASRSLISYFWFVAAQWLLLGALGAALLAEKTQRRKALYRQSAEYARKEQWKTAVSLLKGNQLDAFLSLSDSLAYQFLKERAGVGHEGLTHAQLLNAARPEVSEKALAAAATLFAAHQDFAFSPAKKIPQEPKYLLDCLSELLRH
jgi:hypothetical protein